MKDNQSREIMLMEVKVCISKFLLLLLLIEWDIPNSLYVKKGQFILAHGFGVSQLKNGWLHWLGI